MLNINAFALVSLWIYIYLAQYCLNAVKKVSGLIRSDNFIPWSSSFPSFARGIQTSWTVVPRSIRLVKYWLGLLGPSHKVLQESGTYKVKNINIRKRKNALFVLRNTFVFYYIFTSCTIRACAVKNAADVGRFIPRITLLSTPKSKWTLWIRTKML